MNAAAVSVGTRASGLVTNENCILEEGIFVYGYLHLCLRATFAAANNIAVFWACSCLVINVSSENFSIYNYEYWKGKFPFQVACIGIDGQYCIIVLHISCLQLVRVC